MPKGSTRLPPSSRRTFGSKGALAAIDPAKKLHRRKEEVVALLLKRAVEPEELQERYQFSHDAATRLLSDPQILKRCRYLADHRISLVAGEAISRLIELMRSDDRRVALRASCELLDRSGFVPPAEDVVSAPKFQITMNLGSPPQDVRDLRNAAEVGAVDLAEISLPNECYETGTEPAAIEPAGKGKGH